MNQKSLIMALTLVTMMPYLTESVFACEHKMENFGAVITWDERDWERGWSHFGRTIGGGSDCPYEFDYIGSYHPGCFVFGPYANTSGPTDLTGTLYFDGSIYGLDDDEPAFNMDITAEHGAKILASIPITKNFLKYGLVAEPETTIGGHPSISRYLTLQARSSKPLRDIEVRLCDLNPKARSFDLSATQGKLRLSWNKSSSVTVESDCNPK